MKKLLLSFITLLLMTFVLPEQAQAQKLTAAQRVETVNTLRKQLPMDVAPGMKWTKITLENNNTLLHMTFKLNERALGSSLREAKKEFGNMSTAEFKKNIGNEFVQMLEMFGCDGKITFIFSDGTTMSFPMKR